MPARPGPKNGRSRRPIMRYRMRLQLVAWLAAGLISAAGCQTTTNTTGTDVCCDAFTIIRPSRMDTPKTQQQIYEHNAVYEALCGSRQTRNDGKKRRND